MSDKKSGKRPYSKLGGRLRSIRENRKETLSEVSGAVEIDVQSLEQIEGGEVRPNEDILLLLISYFDIADETANNLWELAGYADSKTLGAQQTSSFDLGQPVAMVMPMDLRVVYTDMVHVMINNYGVVMNFMQGAGPNNQPLAVARIGMSREHAESVLEVLQQTLSQASQAPKAISDVSSHKDSSQKLKGE
jgi:DNA-binding XRE family transcriptional regulator